LKKYHFRYLLSAKPVAKCLDLYQPKNSKDLLDEPHIYPLHRQSDLSSKGRIPVELSVLENPGAYRVP